jgi:ABC-type transport system substrate-binding protein
MKTYWDEFMQSRISRRRSLAVSGIALGSAAALSLIGCGGGNDSNNGNEASGILTKSSDTTKQAVAGGEFHDRIPSDANYYLLDSNFNESGNPGIAGWVYPHFVKGKLGTVDNLPTGISEGDFAESWEQSPDGLKVTFRVRPGIKWDPRAPTNGRIADSQDI